MAQLAVLECPSLALQLVLRRRPELQGLPLVLSRSESPGARVLSLSAAARARRICPQQTLAQARSLAPRLVTESWPEAELLLCREALAQLFCEVAPQVAFLAGADDVLVLNVRGLEGLIGSLEAWAQARLASLKARRLWGRIVLGFEPLPARILCPLARPILRLHSAQEERAQLRQQPLSALGLSPQLQGRLAPLGLQRVGDYLDLGAQALGRRYGEEAARLQRWLSGAESPALKTWDPPQPPRVRKDLEAEIERQDQLLFAVKAELHPLLAGLAQRGRAAAGLLLELSLDAAFVHEGPPSQRWQLRPARPSLDALVLLDLLRLNLERRPLKAPVIGFLLELEPSPACPEQLQLFTSGRRDLDKAEEALARLRAELGEDAVLRASPKPGHLPEARQAWTALEKLRLPEPGPLSGPPPLVRRLLSRPQPLPPPPQQRRRAWLPLGLEGGAVQALVGPYLSSGGWWAQAQARRYFFVGLARGELLWVFQDETTGAWFLQGRVQ